MTKYEIREICGDWAIYEVRETETEGGERCLLILNSRSNAEYIKAILEHEARYPNAAVPYRPEVAQMSDEEVVAVNRLCCSGGHQCHACPLSGSESVEETCFEVDRRVNGLAERWLELTKKAKEEPGREAEIAQMARDICGLFVPAKEKGKLVCKEWDGCLNHLCDIVEDCERLYDAGWRRQEDVVRCKDCEFAIEEDENLYTCEVYVGGYNSGQTFCSYGKRREGGAERYVEAARSPSPADGGSSLPEGASGADADDTNVGRKSEWISVDERLPEKCERVLIYGEEGICFASRYKGDWLMPMFYAGEITHWMPLPQPPMMKGGDDE